MTKLKLARLALVLPVALSGCGLYVPEKDIFSQDNPDQNGSPQGRRESDIVAHIHCEIRKGVYEAWAAMKSDIPWLKKWGSSVTLTLTVDEQSGLNPGLSVIAPFHNAYGVVAGPQSLPLTPASLAAPTIAAIPQSFSLGLGASATAHSTRVETIQFTYSNKELLDSADTLLKRGQDLSCDRGKNGIMIESDLKISQFIFEKAVIAATANTTSSEHTIWPPYNTFQEQLTFVATFGGNVTPTWKFARTAVDPSGTLLSATRSNTNALTITIGRLTPATDKAPAQLGAQSQNLHNAAVGGSATATAIQGQAR
jgi:hypothetical protein